MRFSFLTVVVLFSSVLLAACEEGLGDCPTDGAAAEAAGQKVVAAQCASCHSSQLTGSQRVGAPEGMNFDKLDIVRAQAEEMLGEVEEGAMPPGAKLADADIENMRVWLACGAKDTTAQ